jgi:cell division protein FtsB
MAPVQDKWRAEYQPSFEDLDIHLPEGTWDNEEPIEIPAYHRRRSAGLWTAVASLAVVLAVMAAYGYSVMSNQNSQLAWLPGLKKSVSAVRDRANGLEASIAKWDARQDHLETQVQKLGTGWKAGLDDARMHAAVLVNNAYQKEREDLNQRTAILNAQIAAVTSRQQAEQAHVARLERQLASTRQELASVQESNGRELAEVQNGQISNRRAIASINDVLSTDQVNFEAEKNHDSEIVPGVSLHMTGADIARQRFGGWILLAGNRRRIWFRHQTIETPLVFYPVPGGEAYELVVTSVKQKEVAGYLLVPSNSKSQQADVASNSRPITQSTQSAF